VNIHEEMFVRSFIAPDKKDGLEQAIHDGPSFLDTRSEVAMGHC
jgi:hypothetical protein